MMAARAPLDICGQNEPDRSRNRDVGSHSDSGASEAP